MVTKVKKGNLGDGESQGGCIAKKSRVGPMADLFKLE